LRDPAFAELLPHFRVGMKFALSDALSFRIDPRRSLRFFTLECDLPT
jgi:hypothetical protein